VISGKPSCLFQERMNKTVPLKKNLEFIKVFRKGKCCRGSFLYLYVFSSGLPYNRLGISISRKVGKSVIRNRIRRLIKEIYRLNERKMRTGVDIVFTVKPGLLIPCYKDTQKEILYLAGKANLIDRENQDCSESS
jgi:ribonuclease P protein component